MSIAIIAEYNPFHNGHIYQINEAKKRWPNEDIIIFMSGKYVQRGERAIISAKDRINYAKKYGANDVILLPFEVSTQAAHIFADGAVKLINKHGIDKIFFGSESGDAIMLMKIAEILKVKRTEYRIALKRELKQGNSFPKSASIALEEISGKSFILPNDILGFEYCKSIVNNNFNIHPYCLKRTIHFHSDETIDNFASASKIRKMIKEGLDVSNYTPVNFDEVKFLQPIEEDYKKFQKIVKNTDAKELSKIKLMSEGMENLFKKHIDASSYEEFVNRTNSKRYTSSRIKRVMLYVLLQLN